MGRTTNGSMEPTPRARFALALLFGVATVACGSLTAGGFGEATVVMSGDAPDQAPQATGTAPQPAIVGSDESAGGSPSTVAGAPSAIGDDPLTTSHDDDDPEGQLEADLTVYLVSAAGDVVAVTDGEVEVRLDLDGVEEPEVGSRRVTATTYTDLRMVFSDIEVQVDAGLIIDGQPVTGLVDVEFDDLQLTVDKAIDIEIAEGGRVELLIDLNADSWLLAVDPVMQTVDAQVFADLVTVTVR